jgi:hypothetical protein
MLYEKHNYLNKNIEYLIGNEITEYDIQSAGFNICKKYKLLDDNKLRHLELLDKKRRQITLGLYQQNNLEFKEALNEKFVEVRKLFFESNNIKDEDVLSIKKDAIITLKKCYNTEFDNIRFLDKNTYTSYFYINKFELYVNNDELHLKGISDEKLELHKKYMIDFLHKIFRLIETNPNKKYIIDNMKEFISFYKDKRLHIGYYRELNKDSLYKLDRSFINENIGLQHTKSLENIDISYNYMKYIVPIINILL